jgi:hypothetical protein
MGDVLVFLMLMAYLVALVGLAWVLGRAGARYVRWQSGRVVDGSIKDDLKNGMAGIAWLVSFIAAMFASFFGCLLSIILGLVALFVVFLLVKLLWEMA